MLKIYMKQNINQQLAKKESTGLRYFNDVKAFIKYSNDMEDIYENSEEKNRNEKRKICLVIKNLI